MEFLGDGGFYGIIKENVIYGWKLGKIILMSYIVFIRLDYKKLENIINLLYITLF